MKGQIDKQSTAYKKQREQVLKTLQNARFRCTNPKAKDYANYGGQGIKVLIGADALIDLIGFPKPGETIDRVDPNGHYEAGNLRWANKAIQALNKKSASSNLPSALYGLVTQQKHLSAQKALRPLVAAAWCTVIEALNCGKITASKAAKISEGLGIVDPLSELAKVDICIEKNTDRVFQVPCLSSPGKLVSFRANRGICPEDWQADFIRRGLLFAFSQTHGSVNIPRQLRDAFNNLLEDPQCPGLTLVEPVGSPGPAMQGNLDIWMLAAASRLRQRHIGTANYPALIALDLLGGIGSRSAWQRIRHPVLDAALLFIPDFQLDCGPWGALSAGQLSELQVLLEYRSEHGHQTIAGVQAPAKLTAGLKKILLGDHQVREVAAHTYGGPITVSNPIGFTSGAGQSGQKLPIVFGES